MHFILQGYGNWSVSMWVYLMHKPSSQYRSLLYKGNSNSSNGRTPSAWFVPDSNYLTIRASTLVETNAGALNLKEIPRFEWTLLTFTFQNFSESKLARRTQSIVEASQKLGILVSDKSSGEDVEILSEDTNNNSSSSTSSSSGKSYMINLYQGAELDVS